MAIKDKLSEITSLSSVSSYVLCSRKGKVFEKSLPRHLHENDYMKEVVSPKIREAMAKLKESEDGFVEMPVSDTGHTWIAKAVGNLILLLLLNADADKYKLKLNVDILMPELAKEKEVSKMLAKEATLPIARVNEVHVWEVITFNDYLRREGLDKGIIITGKAYDKKVEAELSKSDNRIEVMVSEKPKDGMKRLTKRLEDQGFKVENAEGVFNRWM